MGKLCYVLIFLFWIGAKIFLPFLLFLFINSHDSSIIAMEMSQKFMEHFRRVADGFIQRFEYDSAIFIIEKLLRLSKDDLKYSEDVERLCFCFFQLGEYHRVISIIKSKTTVQTHLGCACLLIKSYVSLVFFFLLIY